MKVIDVEKIFGESFHYTTHENKTKVLFRCICGNHHSDESEFNTTFDLTNGHYYTFGKCNTHFSPFLVSDSITRRARQGAFFQFLIHRNYDPKLRYIYQSGLKNVAKPKESWADYMTNRRIGVDSLYLKARGVPRNLIEKFGILASINDTDVVFPLTGRNGKINGVQIRYETRKHKYKIVRNKRTAFSPLSVLNEYDATKPLYITEGWFGMLNLIKHGYQAVCMLGKSGMSSIENIAQFDTVIGCFDNDDAGKNYAKKLLRLPIESRVCEGAEYDELTGDDLSAILGRSTGYVHGIKSLFTPTYLHTESQVVEEDSFFDDNFVPNTIKG